MKWDILTVVLKILDCILIILEKLQDAKDSLLYAERYMAELGKTIDRLNRQKLSERQVLEYLDALFPLLDKATEQQQKNILRMAMR